MRALPDDGRGAPDRVHGTAGFTMAERLDPFWDGVWPNGSSGMWTTADDARRQGASGVSRVPWYLRGDADDGLAFLDPRTGPRHEMTLAALGAIAQWRTMTTEQLAALTGYPSLASRANPWLRAGFSAGVVDVGGFSTPLPRGEAEPRWRLVRPSSSDTFERELAPRMTSDELTSVTGGVPWNARRQFDRHNILATELGLRIAEHCDVGTVLGETLSTLDLLFQVPAERLSATSGMRAADLTVVRHDGLRIAVEITASANSGLRARAERWARTLSRSPLSKSGVVVLFVVCPPPEDAGTVVRGGRSRAVTDAVLREASAAARRYPGSPTDRTATRMAVARWDDWFPSSRRTAAGFAGLRAFRPTGPPAAPEELSKTRTWEPVTLLDTTDLQLATNDRSNMTAVVDNASLLSGTPHWLRAGTTDDNADRHAA